MYLNHWFVDHAEARRQLDDHGGYLLAYKRHFAVVDADYIRTLGLDPDDADWAALERDWARPASFDARRRLYGKLLAQGAGKAG